MFQITATEKREVVANCDHLKRLKFSPTLPYAFTEHGAIMAANVANTPRAVQIGVYIPPRHDSCSLDPGGLVPPVKKSCKRDARAAGEVRPLPACPAGEEVFSACVFHKTHSSAERAGRGSSVRCTSLVSLDKTRSPAGQAGRGRDLLLCRGKACSPIAP